MCATSRGLARRGRLFGRFLVLPLYHCICCGSFVTPLLASQILTLSSYNFAVYSSIFARDCVIFTATEAMLLQNNSTANLTTILGAPTTAFSPVYARPIYNTAARMQSLFTNNSLARLEVKDCLAAYKTIFQTERGSLIFVTSDTTNKLALPYAYDNMYSTVLRSPTVSCPVSKETM